MEQTDKRKQDKLKFDRVINLARRLPQPAIHDLLRALILPIQADYLLAVGTEGQDARPDMNEREFFFTKIIWAMDYTHMKSLRLAAEDLKIFPWRLRRPRSCRGRGVNQATGVL
nr:FipA [Klebsiella variicola]